MMDNTVDNTNQCNSKPEGYTEKKEKPQIVSKCLGQGTYGIIIYDPRLPSENETWQSILQSSSARNQVSKIIKNADDSDLKKLNWIIDIINERFNHSNLAQLQTYIVIPSRPQNINWHALLGVSYEQTEFLKTHKISKRRHKWQYILERGTADLDMQLLAVKTVNQFKYFLKSFANIIDGILALHTAGLVHTDIKLPNMIVSCDSRYKLIDLDELSDTCRLPTNKYQFEKIYNNVYYPYYPLVGVFLWVLSRPNQNKFDEHQINMLISDLVKDNYNKDYYQYYIEITKTTIETANDPELARILQLQYTEDKELFDYLMNFSQKIINQPDRVSAHQQLLLFIDRYALGINLLILLRNYYRITSQITTAEPKSANETDHVNACPFISQSLITLIKLCCNTENYARITTQQIADKYREFIIELFQSYPYKLIIKLLPA